METKYERDLARAIRVERYWEVLGCSYQGRTTKRDKKVVGCGHRHSSREECQPCVEKMRLERPGKCQDYRPAEMEVMVLPK